MYGDIYCTANAYMTYIVPETRWAIYINCNVSIHEVPISDETKRARLLLGCPLSLG